MVEAIVEHDYVAKESDELTIRKGDLIRDVVKKQAGWCEGILNDKRGLFPDNFVKLIDKEVTLRNRNEAHRVRKCRVVFSYAQDHEDELNLNVGDVIEIIGEEEEGWWKGVLDGRSGVFPSNFVEEVVQSGSKDNSVEDLTNSATDFEHKTPCLPPKPTKILCEVKYPYKAQNEDELSLKESEIVTLISKEGQDAGWWRGELNGKVGVFPDNFVVILDERGPKDDKKPQNYPTKYIASQRKSQEVKPETRLEPPTSDIARGVPPAVPGKKPSLPIKKSPSGSGSGGGLLSGLRKKIADVVDGATVSKSRQYEVKTDESQENAFDQVERNSMLHDVRASRVKAPGRRPPSVVYKEGDPAPTVLNGNSDYGSLEENLSSSNTSIEQELGEVRPKVREWEKHKAPWLEEMKLNQAKRTSTSPGPETRNKLTTPDKPPTEAEEPKPLETSPVDMSKSMPSLSSVKKPEKILKTPPNELEKTVVLRNKPVVNTRPQTIDTPKPASKISPIMKTPSPVQKPPIVEKPVLTEITVKQFVDLLERVGKLESALEKQNLNHEAAIEDLKGKLQIETELRMQCEAELERISQCVTQV